MSRWRRQYEQEHGQGQLKQNPQNDRKINDPPPWPRQSSSEEEMQQKNTRIPISTPKTTIGVRRAAGASKGGAERPHNLRNGSKSNLEASGVCAEASVDMWICRGRPRIRPIVTSAAGVRRRRFYKPPVTMPATCSTALSPPQTLILSFIAEYRLFISLVWRCVYAIAMEGAYNHDAVGETELTRFCKPLFCEDRT